MLLDSDFIPRRDTSQSLSDTDDKQCQVPKSQIPMLMIDI